MEDIFKSHNLFISSGNQVELWRLLLVNLNIAIN